VSGVGLVLDTTAITAYMRGSVRVGAQIAVAADAAFDVLVPATCLAQAYREADAVTFHLLDVLADLPNVVVAPLERGHCSVLGGWARALGSLDLAHAVIETAAHPIVPLVTSRADLATSILPAAWPMIAP
jgi:hypothetical protein